MSKSTDKHLHNADKITAHAQKTNAGRVTFRDSKGFLFSKPERDEVLRLLQAHDPSRYKLQKLALNGRWKDASKYYAVYDSVVEPLTNLDLSAAKKFSFSDFTRASEEDPRGFRVALRRIFNHVTVAPKPVQLTAWKGYFDEFAQGSTHSDVVFLKTTLELLSVTLEQDIDHEFRDPAIEAALAAIGAMQNKYTTESEQIAYSLMEGKLRSLVDRTAAAESFAHATSIDSQGVIEHFYVDMGAYTYFDSTNTRSSPLVSEIKQSIERLQVAGTENSLAVTVSVDSHFFRIYAPQLYLFAQQLPELDLVILLCGQENDIAKALDDGEKYLQHLVRLNQSGTPRNITYLHAPVPVAIGQVKTFYACARFFAAAQLLQRYERVYLMDADLLAEDNPAPYFERIKKINFGTGNNRDLSRFSPWRRNLAGNVALTGDVAVEQVLPDLLQYMAHGLRMDHSWMLDQNALAFAVERHSSAYTPLDEFKRPFHQPRFRSTWEKRYFASLE